MIYELCCEVGKKADGKKRQQISVTAGKFTHKKYAGERCAESRSKKTGHAAQKKAGGRKASSRKQRTQSESIELTDTGAHGQQGKYGPAGQPRAGGDHGEEIFSKKKQHKGGIGSSWCPEKGQHIISRSCDGREKITHHTS